MATKDVRDSQLDAYRALTMIYIVCVLHVSQIFFDVLDNCLMMFLWEMPAIFFIAGASMRYAKVKTFKETVINRFFRVIIPYWVYLVFAILILGVAYVGGAISYPLESWAFQDYVMTIVGIQCPAIGQAHLWFIFPYMVVSCMFPLMRLLINRFGWCFLVVNMVCLFVLDFIADAVRGQSPIVRVVDVCRDVVGYHVFYVSGYLFYKRLTYKYILLLTLFFVTAFFLLTKGELPNMQFHKFPFDSLFMVYGICTMLLWSVFLNKITIPKLNVLNIWNRRGFTIYLYQGWISLSIFYIVREFLGTCSNMFIIYFMLLIAVVFAFVANSLISGICFSIEQTVVNYVRIIFSTNLIKFK
jgi:hypothetical protein